MAAFDPRELGVGVFVAGAGAGLLSTVVPAAYALAVGLAAALPFLAVGAGIAEGDVETRVVTAAAAFGAGLLAAAVVLTFSLPAVVRTPLVVGATYLAGSLVAVTR